MEKAGADHINPPFNKGKFNMLKNIIALFTLLLLAGCAGIDSRWSEQKMSQNDGAILIKMLPNSSSYNLPPQNRDSWSEIKVTKEPDISGGQALTYRVRMIGSYENRTAVFAGALPAGNYRIASARGATYCCETTLSFTSGFSQFEIREGQLTDLGTLAIIDGKTETDTRRGRSMIIAHDLSHDNNESVTLIRNLSPDLSSTLAKPFLSWLPESVPHDMPVLLRAIKHLQHPATAPKSLSSKSIIYASDYGVIYYTTEKGDSKFVDTGTMTPIESILITSKGDWLVGGEFSTLRQSSDKGKNWKSIQGNLPLGKIISLLQWKDRVILTLSTKDSVFIFSSALGSDEWSQLAKYTKDTSIWNRLWDVKLTSEIYDNQLFTLIPDKQVARLDLTSNQSELTTMPGSAHQISISGDGTLRCYCLSGLFRSAYHESKDFGKTWHEVTGVKYIGMPMFRDKYHGFAFISAENTTFPALAFTEDGGLSWINRDTIGINPSTSLFYGDGGKVIYAVDSDGKYLLSMDDGLSWKRMDE